MIRVRISGLIYVQRDKGFPSTFFVLRKSAKAFAAFRVAPLCKIPANFSKPDSLYSVSSLSISHRRKSSSFHDEGSSVLYPAETNFMYNWHVCGYCSWKCSSKRKSFSRTVFLYVESHNDNDLLMPINAAIDTRGSLSRVVYSNPNQSLSSMYSNNFDLSKRLSLYIEPSSTPILDAYAKMLLVSALALRFAKSYQQFQQEAVGRLKLANQVALVLKILKSTFRVLVAAPVLNLRNVFAMQYKLHGKPMAEELQTFGVPPPLVRYAFAQ